MHSQRAVRCGTLSESRGLNRVPSMPPPVPPVGASTTATHSTMALTENMPRSPLRGASGARSMDINGLSQRVPSSSYPATHLTAAPMSPQRSHT